MLPSSPLTAACCGDSRATNYDYPIHSLLTSARHFAILCVCLYSFLLAGKFQLFDNLMKHARTRLVCPERIS